MAVLSFEDCANNRAPGRMLRRIDRLMSSFVESRFESLDISFMQWIALKLIRDGTVTNAGELARDLTITTGATTRLIDVLEKRGLVERDSALWPYSAYRAGLAALVLGKLERKRRAARELAARTVVIGNGRPAAEAGEDAVKAAAGAARAQGEA